MVYTLNKICCWHTFEKAKRQRECNETTQATSSNYHVIVWILADSFPGLELIEKELCVHLEKIEGEYDREKLFSTLWQSRSKKTSNSGVKSWQDRKMGESMDELLNAEFKEAFDEFDKVAPSFLSSSPSLNQPLYADIQKQNCTAKLPP